jgi:hypothetical protein
MMGAHLSCPRHFASALCGRKGALAPGAGLGPAFTVMVCAVGRSALWVMGVAGTDEQLRRRTSVPAGPWRVKDSAA